MKIKDQYRSSGVLQHQLNLMSIMFNFHPRRDLIIQNMTDEKKKTICKEWPSMIIIIKCENIVEVNSYHGVEAKTNFEYTLQPPVCLAEVYYDVDLKVHCHYLKETEMRLWGYGIANMSLAIRDDRGYVYRRAFHQVKISKSSVSSKGLSK